MNSQTYMNFHGILLYRKNFKERDMLVKFLTAEVGKKMFFIRGARKRGFKMMPEILPFTYGLYSGKISRDNLSYIYSALDTDHYENISQDIYLNAYSTYIMSLIDVAFPDSTPILGWFNKLFEALKLINNGIDAAIITNIIEIQLLNVFGVQPEFRGCTICGRNDLSMDYSEAYGGLICAKHYHMDPHRLHLDAKTVFYLRKFSVIDIQKINNINVNENTKRNLRNVLDKLYQDTVGINLKSKHFLDQMKDLKL
ncbi:DNA repair protein RecO [Apilactobacillus timberlakei]|uniref:DNA repair protein RecO n=1 Tax=Apilactobacillus timberlakei TaxID=2008380 RepID=UPI0011269C95|nr:DNA repair protein RecO [Apilactobacillus timberlakei]TPR13868.1 DNA repair protein RecO [Apilactobacillus timberlakei]TPR23970.1 DNA repair protein RecO [Apilactobacillus timberlakei]